MVYVPRVLGTTNFYRNILGALTLAALKLALPVAGRFPRPAYALARTAGWLAWRLRRGARRRVTNNLLPACGGDHALAIAASQKTFQNIASYYVDLATLPFRNGPTFEQEHIRLMGREHLPALLKPGPVLVASAHTGNPELAMLAVTQRGRSLVELVEPLSPPALSREMTRLREFAGGKVVYADYRGTREAFRKLRAGGMVAVMADRNLGRGGICTNLLGQKVLLPRGPWELARRSGATVVPLFLSRNFADDQTVWIEEPFTVPGEGDRDEALKSAAQHWANFFGTHLERDAGQWTVLEAFWETHSCG